MRPIETPLSAAISHAHKKSISKLWKCFQKSHNNRMIDNITISIVHAIQKKRDFLHRATNADSESTPSNDAPCGTLFPHLLMMKLILRTMRQIHRQIHMGILMVKSGLLKKVNRRLVVRVGIDENHARTHFDEFIAQRAE